MMQLTLEEKSKYYRGLLIISRRDRVIDSKERHLLLHIGECFGFDKRFCETTINELLINPHISREPIVLSDESTRESFFRDAIRIACSDGTFHPIELSWLRKTAQANGWTNQRLENIIQGILANPG
jgi:hypothetical protein